MISGHCFSNRPAAGKHFGETPLLAPPLFGSCRDLHYRWHLRRGCSGAGRRASSACSVSALWPSPQQRNLAGPCVHAMLQQLYLQGRVQPCLGSSWASYCLQMPSPLQLQTAAKQASAPGEGARQVPATAPGSQPNVASSFSCPLTAVCGCLGYCRRSQPTAALGTSESAPTPEMAFAATRIGQTPLRPSPP